MSKQNLIELFCTRFSHDILSPIGALQLAVDNWKDYKDDSSAQLIEKSMHAIVSIFDLMRKSYGYRSDNVTLEQFDKIVKDNFDKQMQYSDNILHDKKFTGVIFKLLLWFKHKILNETQIDMKMLDGQLQINVQNIFLNDEELLLLNNEKKEYNSYLIYLILLLDEEIKIIYKYDTELKNLNLNISY